MSAILTPRRPSNEERLKRLMDSNIIGVHIADIHGNIKEANDSFLNMIGYTRGDLLSGKVRWTDLTPHEWRPWDHRNLQELKICGVAAPWEKQCFRKDGTQIPIQLGAALLPETDGDCIYYTLDLTDRKRAERRLAGQHAVTRVLAESATLNEATPKLLQAVCESLGWELGAMWNVDTEAKLLRCIDVWHVPTRELVKFANICRKRSFPPGIGLPGRVWLSTKPAWIPDVVRDSNFPRAPFAAQVGLHGAFGFPIIFAGQILGVIEFFSREIQEPDSELLQMLASTGSQIGQFTHRKRAEESLIESELRFRALAQSAVDAIISAESRGSIISWNHSAEIIFGYRESEILGKSIARLFPPRYRDGQERGLRSMSHGALAQLAGRTLELQGLKKGRKTFPMELSISQWTAGGRPFYTAIVRDITERKRAEEAEALRKREAMQREFIANVSHEFRTPVSAIKGFAETLSHGGMDDHEHRLEFVQTIERHADRLSRLVENLLELSSLESGKKPPKPEAVVLLDLVEKYIESISPLAKAKSLSVKIRIPRHLKAPIDKTMITQVLQILCENAIEYNKLGGRIWIEARKQKKLILVSVHDTGIGIPRKDLRRIFERFHRTRRARSRKPGGTGLGLAIARNILNAHGGQIWAENARGKGSIFRFSLPLS